MNNKLYFFLLSFILIVLSITNKEVLNYHQLLLNSLSEQLTNNQIEDSLDFQEKWELLGYALIPLSILIKTFLISSIIDAGCFLFDKKIEYKKIFNFVIKAEFIFILPIVIKLIWFYFFQQNYTLEDLIYFYPLSALSIVGHEGLNPWWIYPFQVLNLFEFFYYLILAYLLSKELKISTDKGLYIIGSSYGISLAIWVIGVMFFTLSLT